MPTLNPKESKHHYVDLQTTHAHLQRGEEILTDQGEEVLAEEEGLSVGECREIFSLPDGDA